MYNGDSGASAWASVANLQLMHTSCVHPMNVFLQVSGAPAPTPTTSLLTPVYQHASVAALYILASARLRRALPLSLSFFSSFSLPYK
jgi:hypothetical protein